MTTAAKQPPHHNTTTCYTDYRCRLPECVERYNALNRDRVRARKAGTYSVFVDAEPVRRYILRLQRAGMGTDSIAAAAGVPKQSILEFLRPLPTQGRGRRQRTTPTTAAKILAVTPAIRTVGRIDGTGTRRRIQALVALGWPVTHIARHAGLFDSDAHSILQRPCVYVRTANTVASTYDTLRTLRPARKGVTKQHIQRAKNRAARNGWPPPKYWDQHPGAIDDPDFTPEYGKTRSEILTEEATWLMATFGFDMEGAADRLGITRRHLDRAFADVREEAAA